MPGVKIPAKKPPLIFTAELNFLFFIFKSKVARTRNGALKVKGIFREGRRVGVPFLV
jgi:hypothetical protein